MAEPVQYPGDDMSKTMSPGPTVPVAEQRTPSPVPTQIPHSGVRSPASDVEAAPPAWGHHRVIEETAGDVKTINIHIQINVPSTFTLPSFRGFRSGNRRSCFFKRDGPRKCNIPRFLTVLLTVVYLSAIACAGGAWGVKENEGIYKIPVAPLIIATFSPLVDAFATVCTILLIRRYKNSESQPKFRYFLVTMMNLALFILHLVLLILAGTWNNISTWDYGYRYSFSVAKKNDIMALMLYNTSVMIVIKIVLFLAILKNAGLRRDFKDSVVQFPSMVKKECSGEYSEYESLTNDIDDDARQIPSARTSTEGRIFLN